MKQMYNSLIYTFLSIFFSILPIMQTPFFQNYFFNHSTSKTTLGILLMTIYIFIGLLILKFMLSSRLQFSYANTYTDKKNLMNERYMFFITLSFMIIVIFVLQIFFGTVGNKIIAFSLLLLILPTSYKYSRKFSKSEKLDMLKTLPPVVYYQFKLLVFLGEFIESLFTKK